MDSWRLSCIEEEMERLDLSPGSDNANYKLPGQGHATSALHPQKPEAKTISYPIKGILKNANSNGIYSKPNQQVKTAETTEEAAIRKVTGKYDSLERIRPGHERATNQYCSNSLPRSMGRTRTPLPNEHRGGQSSPQMSRAECNSNEAAVVQERLLSQQDVTQIEMFYRSHKTDVWVCRCVVHLYFGQAAKQAPANGPKHTDEWTFIKTGVPVLVLDSGKSRRNRRLSLVLAEKGTGFVLWKDIINHCTDYRPEHTNFHTMHLSSDHSRMAGFGFADPSAAAGFLSHFQALVSNPNDDLLNLGNKKKKKKEKKTPKSKIPTKANISSPCCFNHITKLEQADGLLLLEKATGKKRDSTSGPSS